MDKFPRFTSAEIEGAFFAHASAIFVQVKALLIEMLVSFRFAYQLSKPLPRSNY